MMNVFEKVYEAVKLIPEGSVATYGQVAQAVGNPRLSRAVGYALHVNPQPGVIPCHRVVKRDGEVSSAFAFGGGNRQVELLQAGHEVVCLDNLSNASPKAQERVEQLAGRKVPFYRADVRDRAALERVFRVKKRDVRTAVSFTDEKPTVIARLSLSLSIFAIFAIALPAGVRFLRATKDTTREAADTSDSGTNL